MKRSLGFALAASAALSLSLAAHAAPERTRIRGTVASTDSSTITVHTGNGDVPITVGSDTRYSKVVKSSLDKVEQGSYIGVATKEFGPSQVALEVLVFPPAMKGAGEGHYDWDRLPDTTIPGNASTPSTMTNGQVASSTSAGGTSEMVESKMTNGTVSTSNAQGTGKQLVVTYKGGQQTILVPPTAPIVTFNPGAKSDVKQGDSVFVVATKDAGKTTANLVAVGADGVKPPM